MDRTIHKRLMIGQAAIVLVLVLSTVTAIVALRSTLKQTERLGQIDERLENIDHLRAGVRELARSIRRYLLTGDLGERQAAQALEDKLRAERTRLPKREPELERRLDNYLTAVARSKSKDRSDPGVLASFEDELALVRGPLAIAFDEIVTRLRSELETSRSSQRLARGAQWGLVVAAAMGAFLAIGILATINRILRRQAEQVRSADVASKRTAESRQQLLAAGDELLSPIEAILTEAAQLRSTTTEEETHRRLESITTSASKVDLQLRQLLDMTGIQTGKLIVRRELFSVAPVLERAVKHHRELATTHGVRISFEPTGFLSVVADRDRIGQVVTLLLELAVSSARSGTEVVVSAAGTDDGARFAIDTNSPPPTGESLPTDNLSLQFCKQIIDAHGGRIGVDASAGRSWFTLPTEPKLLR